MNPFLFSYNLPPCYHEFSTQHFTIICTYLSLTISSCTPKPPKFSLSSSPQVASFFLLPAKNLLKHTDRPRQISKTCPLLEPLYKQVTRFFFFSPQGNTKRNAGEICNSKNQIRGVLHCPQKAYEIPHCEFIADLSVAV